MGDLRVRCHTALNVELGRQKSLAPWALGWEMWTGNTIIALILLALAVGGAVNAGLPFAAPPFRVSLVRISGLGARRAITAATTSIVRLPQSRADDGADRYGQTSLQVGHRSSAERS
jgi:hypothetical protein